jgi:RNase P/RNase MRP subunit POP5
LVKRKKRYIIIEASTEIPVEVFKKLIEKSYLELFGEFGLNEANLRLVKKINNKFILECFHNSVSRAILSISSIRKLDDSLVCLRVVKVTGTIRKAREIIAEG